MGLSAAGTVRCCVGRGEALPFRAGRFDIVLCWFVLHELVDAPGGIIPRILTECRRIIGLGGRCIVVEYQPAFNPRRARRLAPGALQAMLRDTWGDPGCSLDVQPDRFYQIAVHIPDPERSLQSGGRGVHEDWP